MTTNTYGTLSEHERRVLGAFKLAMRKHGVPEHPDGQCPTWDCDCRAMEDFIEASAVELLAEPGIEDAQLCHDCRVLVPLTADCYMIDCGYVVCLVCGPKRGLTHTVLS
ncbi:MAG: hypothetical protein ACRDKL_08475 [Solirubrobacteraceae bacterium]